MPYAANLHLFDEGATNVTNATAANTTAINAGNSFLFSSVSAGNISAARNNGAQVITNENITNFNTANDIITISRATNALAFESRIDVIEGLQNKTSFVRVDEVLSPNTTYTNTEWVAFVDDALSSSFDNFLRHPEAPILSEVSNNTNPTANTLLGLHSFGVTNRVSNSWDNGFPDRSRAVLINESYKHTNNPLIARKLAINGNAILSLDNQLLVVSNEVAISENAEIRMIGSSQLIQTHTGSSKADGLGKLYIDQNSDIASIYRYNYMGSPVTTVGTDNYSIASVFKDGSNPVTHEGVVGQGINNIARNINFVAGLDGSDGVPISITDRWIYTFANSNGASARYVRKNQGDEIASTDGYIFKGPGVAQNYTFVGNPNDGEYTTQVGANESYLLANPYPSALNGLKFIIDNINSINGTLYFWDHVGEEDTSTDNRGHYFNGYIGGYATLNLSMSVASVNKPIVGAFNVVLESENAISNVPSSTKNSEEVLNLTNNIDFVEFSAITRATDKITLNYIAETGKTVRFLLNGGVIDSYDLPATSTFSTFVINRCVTLGSSVRFESQDQKDFYLDNITISDDDGDISCAPSTGTDASLYKTPGSFIPLAQGFFIGGDSDGGTITFNNSQRQFITESASNSVFFKSRKKNIAARTRTGDFNRLPYIKLRMDFVSEEGRSLSRQIGVSFSASNTFKFDKGYDSEITDLGATDIYWKFPENESKYVIAGVENISDDLEIPLEIIMNYDGTNILKIDEVNAIDAKIYLKDKLTNETKLITDNEIAIQLKKGTYEDRFAIIFKETALSVNDTEDFIASNLSIYIDTTQKELVLQNNNQLTINKVTLYNLLGQKINSWKDLEKTIENRLKIKNAPDAIYLVNIQTPEGVFSKKIYVK